MQLNIVNLLYLFFRLAPFIIVCYFTLQSIFNQDLKGLIYLVGLLIAAAVTIMIGNILPEDQSKTLLGLGTPDSKFAKAKCNQLTLGKGQPLSNLPLSQTVFGYTLAYLSYFISVNSLQTQNVPMFVIFPIVILADMYWNASNGCSSNIYLLSALILGGLVGALWAMIIDSTKMANLAYFSGISNKDVCSQPKKNMYRCRTVTVNSSS